MTAIELLTIILGGGAVAAIISGGVQIVLWQLNRKASTIDRKNEKDGYIKVALQLLMHDRIKYRGKRYISNGEVDAEDLRDLMQMHKCYHDDLGGNGFLDNLMGQVKVLPLKK